MPCPVSLLFINLHGSEYLVAAQLCSQGDGAVGGGKSSPAGSTWEDGSLNALWKLVTPRVVSKGREKLHRGSSRGSWLELYVS